MKELYEQWVASWNGLNDDLQRITAIDCVVHQQRMDQGANVGGQALQRIVAEGTFFLKECQMTVIVGPLIDPPYLSARWSLRGIYTGGCREQRRL